jgi:hypothetical protein
VNFRSCVRLTLGTEYNWTQKYLIHTIDVWNIFCKSGGLDMVMVWIFEVTSDQQGSYANDSSNAVWGVCSHI